MDTSFKPFVSTKDPDIGETYTITHNLKKETLSKNMGVSESVLSGAAATVPIAKNNIPKDLSSAHCSLVNPVQPKKNYSLQNTIVFKPGDKNSFRPAADLSQSKSKKLYEKGCDFAPFDDNHIYISRNSGFNEGITIPNMGDRTTKFTTPEEDQEFHSFLSGHFTFLNTSKESKNEEEHDTKYSPFNVKRSHIPLDVAVSPNSNNTIKHFVTNENRQNNSLLNEQSLDDTIEKHSDEKDIQKKEKEKEVLKKGIRYEVVRSCYNRASTDHATRINQTLEIGEIKAIPILMPARAA